MDRTTCEFCRGTGKMPMLNVWKIAKTEDLRVGCFKSIDDAGCPECNRDALDGLIMALLEKHGEPFQDSSFANDGWHYQLWLSPDRRQFVVPITGWMEHKP